MTARRACGLSQGVNSKHALALLLALLLGCKAIDNLRGDAEEQPAASSSASVAPSASSAPAAGGKQAQSSKFDIIPLAVGQFVRYRGGGTSEGTLAMAIVGEERDAYWFEIVNELKIGRTVVGLLIKTPPDRRDPENFEVLSVKMKLPSGQVQRFEGASAGQITHMSKQWLHRLSLPNFERLPREDVEVKAGSFEHCARHETKEKLMGFQMDVVSWHHPKVPVTAMVKQQGSIDGKPTSFELVEYGLTGAKSEF